MKIDLIRHGESVNNAEGLITGRLNVPLTDKGRLQARLLGTKLWPYYDGVFSSYLQRSRDTLDLALSVRKPPYWVRTADNRLDERCLGVLEGQPRQHIEAYSNGDLDYAPEGGESYRDLAKRVMSFLGSIRFRYGLDRILICSHVGTMRMIVGILEDYDTAKEVLDLQFDNAELYQVKMKKLTTPDFLKL